MNSDQEKIITSRPPWHPYVSGIIGLIFGPVAAAIVTYINFKIFGCQVKATLTLLLTIIGTIGLMLILFRLTEQAASDVGSVVGNVISPLLFPAIQWYDYREWKLKNPGVDTYSGWKSVGWGVVGLVSYFVIAFILILILGYASGISPDEEWNRTFGRVDNDWASSVQQTSDGGYILAGSTADGSFYADCWLIKTDSKGNEIWNKTFGDIICYAKSVQQTSDGGYIFGGTTCYISEQDAVSIKVSSDFLLVKTDSRGNEQWNKTFGGINDDSAYSVLQTSDGGYILAGSTTDDAFDKDYWLVKTDSSGDEQWNKTFGGTDYDCAYSIQQTSDGGYIFVGSTEAYGTGTESYGTGSCDFWLIKTDSNGNWQWDKTFGGTGDDMAGSVQETSDGGYILAGSTSDNAFDTDLWLVKTDSKGNEQWDITFGGSCLDLGGAAQQTSDGGYILAGSTGSYGNGSFDFWLIKTDSNGNWQWDKTFGGTGDDGAGSVQQTSDDGYILAGGTDSHGAGNEDAWLVKVKGQK